MSEHIELAIEQNSWAEAARLIQQELVNDPDNHWYWARLALCEYESLNYRKAIKLALCAMEIHPGCPLAQWEYAGALDMLGREQEAIEVWLRLIHTEPATIADEPCWEDEAWAESLINNCRYRLVRTYLDLEDPENARHWMQEHLSHRKEGLDSIVSDLEVFSLAAEIEG